MNREAEIPYHGFYINLDRSPARRERMEAQLKSLGLGERYGRFPAADGTTLNPARSRIGAGETGAFVSHMRALEQAGEAGLPVHILEDDALLCEHARPLIDEAIATGLFERFDMIFTDTLFAPHLGMLKGLKAAFDRIALPPSRPLRLADLQVIELARENFSCLTSYVVGAGSLQPIVALLHAEWENGPSRPVDLFIRDCVHSGQLRAGLLFPFVTSLCLDEIAGSTIGPGTALAKPSVMVLAVLRYLFYVGRDLGYAKSCLDAATRQNRKPTDPHHDMIAQAVEFILSPDFQQF